MDYVELLLQNKSKLSEDIMSIEVML